MKTLTSTALSIIALSLGLGSCSAPKEEADPNTISFNHERAAAAFSMDSSAVEFGLDSDFTVGCRLDLLMPTHIYGHDLTALTDTIHSIALGQSKLDVSIKEFFSQSASQFGCSVTPIELSSQMADSMEMYTNAVAKFDGFIETKSYVQTLTPYFMSYAVNTNEYAPRAAHGMGTCYYVNYDVNENKIITLDSIFTTTGLEQLPTIVRHKARQMERLLGTTDIQSLPSRNNFYLTADGDIVFAYQVYEVASYVQGQIDVPVEGYVVDSILTQYGKKLLLNE